MAGQKIVLASNVSLLEYDLETHTLDLTPLGGSGLCLQRAGFNLECFVPGKRKMRISLRGRPVQVEEQAIEDAQGIGKQVRINGVDPASGLRISYILNTYPSRPFHLIRLRVENVGSNTFSLSALNLVDACPSDGGEIHLAEEDRPLDFFKVGWHDWVYTGLRHGDQRDVDSLFALKQFTGKMLYNPATPIGRLRGQFWGENWGILSSQKAALLAGLVSMADQFGLLHADCRPGKASLTLSALVDGVPLAPGESFESEWGYLEWMPLPVIDPMAEYVQAVARQMKPRLSPVVPPAMWTHWYYYFEHITQEQFLENLEAADRLRNTIPYEIFQLDGGYYKHWGDYLDWNDSFPIGPKELSARISEKGFMPGIWLAPFVVDPASTVARDHPDWLVRDTKGKPITSGFFYSFYGNALDLTQPAVLDHIRTLMDTLAHKLGFGFIKTDFVYAGALPGVRHNPKMTRAQAFRQGMEAVREGIGEETYLLGCGCPMGPAIGIVDAIRVGPDTAPRWEPYLWSVPWATVLLKEDRSVAALRNNIRHTINLSALHRHWWWNDPDCLMVRSDNTTLTPDEVRSNATLIGINGSLLIHSDNLNKLAGEQIALASVLTPTLESDARALDLLEKEMPEIYAARHIHPIGEWVNVALFNWNDLPADKSLDLQKFGFAPGEGLHGFDFWENRYFSCKAGLLEFKQIPAHGCKLLRFCVMDGSPCVVGDTLHISQGAEWAESCRNEMLWEVKTIEMKREVRGALWLWLPEKPKIIQANGVEIPFAVEEGNIVQVPLNFNGKVIIEITR
jgi:alpha-galactosidase